MLSVVTTRTPLIAEIQEQCSHLFALLSFLRHTGAMPAVRTARALARAELTRAILDRARDQLAEVGPAALSVRQIARDLEMASSAVYRYFPSRDALLTALIVEGYDDLGEAVETADASVRRRDRFDRRWSAVAHAVHDWARAQPHRYALLYGSPVPGYAAPDDTVPAATRVTFTLLAIVRDAELAGRSPRDVRPVSKAERAALANVRSFLDDAARASHPRPWGIRGTACSARAPPGRRPGTGPRPRRTPARTGGPGPRPSPPTARRRPWGTR